MEIVCKWSTRKFFYLSKKITEKHVLACDFSYLFDVGYLIVEFDKFWVTKEPENVMVFPQLRSEFVDELSWKLRQDNITVLMQINQ